MIKLTEKIKSPEQLKIALDDLRNAAKDKKTALMDTISICTGGGCIASGAYNIKEALESTVKENGLEDKIEIKETGCLGPCARGPVVLMNKDNVLYQKVLAEDAKDIVEKHVINGNIVERLIWRDKMEDNKPVQTMNDLDYFKSQEKIVLRNCGVVTPTSIEDYMIQDGFAAFAKVLGEYKDTDVIEEMKKSGLRGRGGGGFPTWQKWEFARANEADQKFILCNADEGDPGAFMDRSVLEGDPYSVIEGMAIGAFAIGASMGYIYVRAEYPLAVQRLSAAIERAREAGFLGNDIMGTGFNFDLEIRMGSGAFVCGEETALMNSIEGKRGEPRPRPPFPAEKGLWGKPSVLNNVESYANIAPIILKGGDWFASFGTEKSKGTKVFALAGAINNAGLVEVPIGTTLGELIFDIGKGIPNGKAFKAAQLGGPSGGCIPNKNLNVPLDFESVQSLGAIMGSGGLVVMDEDSCMVDVARFFLEFVQEESCGKCPPCRVGTKRMLEILERITKGQGEIEDIDRLEYLGNQIKETALCGLGQTAPNPVLSTIRHFRAEYEQHIIDKHCEAGVCNDLVRAPCQSGCPAHVDVPGFVSLIGEKRYAEALILHRERNPFAAVCARVCFHKCEEKCRRENMDEAVAIRSVKRFMVDQEITVQLPEIRENEENAKRKIAIVGAGPSGLTCAYFLARLGYRPTVFEAEQRPGGMLVQTIPSYRLPREILAREIRMIEGMGVDIQCGKALGKDFYLSDLRKEGYDAVFMGIGTPKSVCLEMPGVNHKDVTNAMDFLKTYNLRGSAAVKKDIVIVGGGNAAADAARTAIRLGAENVTIVYRRSQAEMPAYAEEIDEAIQEGVTLMPLTNPREIIIENDKVVGIRCSKMRLGAFDNTGRRRPITEKESFVISAEQVILACGQSFDQDLIQAGETRLKMYGEYSIVINDQTGQTSVPWVFSGGDCAGLANRTVIEAIGAGERAAVGIDEYLNGEADPFWREQKQIDVSFDPDAEPCSYHRKKLPLLSLERRVNNFDEVEQPWTEADAVRQAQRCLRCDYGK